MHAPRAACTEQGCGCESAQGQTGRVGGARQRECFEAVDAHIVEMEPLRAMARRVEDSERSHAIVHAQVLHRSERRLVPVVSSRHVACPSSARPQLKLRAIKLAAAQKGVCGGTRGTERWRGRRWDGRLAERAGQRGTRVVRCEAKRSAPGKSLRGRGCRRGRVQTKAARRSPG